MNEGARCHVGADSFIHSFIVHSFIHCSFIHSFFWTRTFAHPARTGAYGTHTRDSTSHRLIHCWTRMGGLRRALFIIECACVEQSRMTIKVGFYNALRPILQAVRLKDLPLASERSRSCRLSSVDGCRACGCALDASIWILHKLGQSVAPCWRDDQARVQTQLSMSSLECLRTTRSCGACTGMAWPHGCRVHRLDAARHGTRPRTLPPRAGVVSCV